MSAATLERVTLSDFQVGACGAGIAYCYNFPLRGLTSYGLEYVFTGSPSDRFSNGEPYALPIVRIRKHTTRSYATIRLDAAPQYVRDVVKATMHEVARAEHNRHGIAPLPESLRQAWHALGAWAWTGAKLRKAEELLRQIERPGVRREQAREIAAWVADNWIERDEHQELMDEALAEASETRAAEIAEIEAAHAEERAKLDSAADVVAGEAQDFLEALKNPQGLEFAVGNTAIEKVLDLARDLEAAVTAYERKGSDT